MIGQTVTTPHGRGNSGGSWPPDFPYSPVSIRKRPPIKIIVLIIVF